MTERIDAPHETVWQCKIGVTCPIDLPMAADFPMRQAIQRAFFELTGQPAEFTFSGWAAKLTPTERAVVDERPRV